LGAALGAGVAQVGQYHTTLRFFESRVVKALENAADMFVALRVTGASGKREFDFWSCAIVRSFVSSMLITILG